MQPLADRLRPEAIEDMVGQSHIIGKGKIINRLIENNTKYDFIWSTRDRKDNIS